MQTSLAQAYLSRPAAFRNPLKRSSERVKRLTDSSTSFTISTLKSWFQVEQIPLVKGDTTQQSALSTRKPGWKLTITCYPKKPLSEPVCLLGEEKHHGAILPRAIKLRIPSLIETSFEAPNHLHTDFELQTLPFITAKQFSIKAPPP